MNRNKKITKTMALAMTGLMVANAGMSGVYAADENSKEETVYVKMNPAGETQEVIVSDWLKNTEGSSTITDKSDLTDIENVKGDETFSQDGSNVTWNADGNDIYYQGSTTKALPVNMKIQYFLDGQEVTPDQLAGKSGHVKIVYTYENLSKVGDVYTPFSMITGMILPPENFKNVTVKNGRVISDGEKNIVIGMGLPGLKDSLKLDEFDTFEDVDLDIDIPESFEVEADATDFKLDMSMTVAVPLNLSELDLDDIQDKDDLKDKIQELKDGATDLVDGAGELNDGVKTLKDSCVDLVDGMNQVNDGTGTLKDGIDTLNTKKTALTDGIKALADGLNELNSKKGDLVKGVDQLNTGAAALDKGAGQLQGGINELADGLNQLQKNTPALITGVQEICGGVAGMAEKRQELVDGMAALDQGVNRMKTGAAQLKTGSAAVYQGISALKQSMETNLPGLIAQLTAQETSAGTDSTASGSEQALFGASLNKYVTSVNEYIRGFVAYRTSVGQMVGIILDGTTLGNQSVPGLRGISAEIETFLAQAAQTPDNTSVSAASEAADTGKEESAVDTVTADVSLADANADAIAQLESAIEGDKAVLASLQDVQGKVGSVPNEVIKLYSGAYSTYSGQLDNVIAQMQSDIAAEEAALVALKATQTVQVEVPAPAAADEAQIQTADDPGTGEAAQLNAIQELGKVKAEIDIIIQAIDKYQAGTSEKPGLTATDAKLPVVEEALTKGGTDLLGGLELVKAAVQGMYDQLLNVDTKKGEVGALVQLEAGSKQVADGAAELSAGADSAAPGADALNTGIQTLSDGIIALNNGCSLLGAKVPELSAGVKRLSEGGTELQDGAGTLKDGTKELSDGTKELKKGAGTLSTGVQKLTDGGNQLNAGAGTLSDGIRQLADGGSTLKDGTQKLADGGVDLSEGVDKLYDGSTQLKDGVDKLDEEVLQKVITFADEDLEDMIDRLQNLKDAGDAYQWFTEGSDDATGTVKFVIETTSIE